MNRTHPRACDFKLPNPQHKRRGPLLGGPGTGPSSISAPPSPGFRSRDPPFLSKTQRKGRIELATAPAIFKLPNPQHKRRDPLLGGPGTGPSSISAPPFAWLRVAGSALSLKNAKEWADRTRYRTCDFKRPNPQHKRRDPLSRGPRDRALLDFRSPSPGFGSRDPPFLSKNAKEWADRTRYRTCDFKRPNPQHKRRDPPFRGPLLLWRARRDLNSRSSDRQSDMLTKLHHGPRIPVKFRQMKH